MSSTDATTFLNTTSSSIPTNISYNKKNIKNILITKIKQAHFSSNNNTNNNFQN